MSYNLALHTFYLDSILSLYSRRSAMVPVFGATKLHVNNHVTVQTLLRMVADPHFKITRTSTLLLVSPAPSDGNYWCLWSRR